MKLDKRLGLCIVLLVFMLLFIQNVSALGIAPARKIFDFEPGLEQTVEFKVLNNEHKDMKVALYVGGKLGKYVTLSTYELDFTSADESKTATYKFKLPETMTEPGSHGVEIVAGEVAEEGAVSGISMVVNLVVASQLIINVPYPGKYATTELKVAETGRTDQVDFIVVANNLGTQNIVEAKGTIDIFGPTNEKLATIQSDSGPISANGRGEFKAAWSGDINPGQYLAKLSLSYDGDIAEAERVFNVGSSQIEINNINVRDFKLGEIAKFEIEVENKWSDTMKEVYTELIIKEDVNEIGKFKSASEDVSALSKETLIAYWDTAGVEEGVYDATVILYYDGKSASQDMKAHISLTSIYFDAFGTGAVTGGPIDGEFNWTVIIIVALVLINIGWFVYFKLKGRKKK